MDWEAHRAYQRSAPAREGLKALAAAVSRGSRPVHVRRLGGGLSTATHAIDLRTKGGKILGVVLKRFRDPHPSASREWQRLVFADTLPVPSPAPLALDESGEWFGKPALVMRRLPGRPSLRPTDVAKWIEQIAHTLAAIQRSPTRGAPRIVREPHTVEDWKPPDGLPTNALVKEAITAIRRQLPAALRGDRVFGHSDYHPGNLLWSRGILTGVADWSSAKILPRELEVSYCRTEVNVLLDARAAELFAKSYEGVWGEPLEHLRLWDLVCGLWAVRWSHMWIEAYKEQGRSDLSFARARPRIEAFIRRALAPRR